MDAEIRRLDEQLKWSFEGGAWHGPSLLEALDGLDPSAAFAHPAPGAHSIWEIVLHLLGTYHLVMRRMDGDATALTPSQDWPPVPGKTLPAWLEMVDLLRHANETLRRKIRAFSPAALDLPLVPDPPYSAYTQFIGMTQHNLYHAGQIMVLRKLLS